MAPRGQHENAEGRRGTAAGARGTTPAVPSPRKAASSATPRKARPGAATPGACGTPSASRAASLRTHSLLGAGSVRRGPRGPDGIHSEPASPRGGAAAAAGASLADSCDGWPSALDGLLPAGAAMFDDACSAGAGSAVPPAAAGADNIRVFVRVRPPNAREAAAGARTCVAVAQERAVVLHDTFASAGSAAGRPGPSAAAGSTSGGDREPSVWTFDRVFGPEASQQEVYAAVGEQMVSNVMVGFNSSIFCYGQTGSGKTHTATGEAARGEDGELAEQCGLTLRVFSQLFERIGEEERDGVSYTVKCSHLELYNEECSDLLAPGSSGLAIRDGDAHRGVFVEGLSEHVAVNAEDVMRLVQRGSANRHTAATRMNERSSRSHSVFTAVVEAHEQHAGSGVTNVRFAKLNLIDLAGSERVGKSGATGEHLTEAKSINRSLTTLGRVVTALTERQQHVPYRDSRLTFLLKESIGGNSKTSLVACVSPCDDSAAETFSTLVFAAGAKKIRNKAVVNQDTVGDMKALQLENARLRRELEKREDVAAAELRQQLAAAQAQSALAASQAAAAEGRQQQLETALNESHSTLQQRNAELALVAKEVDELKERYQLLQKDREDYVAHNAALTERVEQVNAQLERSLQVEQRAQQDLAAMTERCEAATSVQRAAEEGARRLQLRIDGLEADSARIAAERAQEQAAREDAERRERLLRRENEQVVADLRRSQREAADMLALAEGREERLKQELAQMTEVASARGARVFELEGQLANETVCTTKYRRMVSEIGKLIDWAQSTSPLPPTLGGRTSPAGYASLKPRLSFGGGAGTPISPLGDASNQRRQSLAGGAAPGSAAHKAGGGPSPGRPQVPPLLVSSPSGRSPLASPSKVR